MPFFSFIFPTVMVLDATMTEVPVTKADLDLIYTTEIKKDKKQKNSATGGLSGALSGDKSDRLDFDDFLSCMLRVAMKCYPSCKNREAAMQQLLMDNILPLASRRHSVTVLPLLKQPSVEALFRYYEDSLHLLFTFFATSSDYRAKGKNMIKTTSNHVKTFDDQTHLIEESKTRNKIQNVVGKNMGYPEFLKFANDFGFSTSLGLSAQDLGEIYLAVISFSNFTASLRQVDFKEFWELLIRCALVAFRDKTSITTEEKIKGLFLSIWRHLQNSAVENMHGYGTLHGGGFNNYKGGLIRGCQTLNEKFVAMWTREGYRDYLEPQNAHLQLSVSGNNDDDSEGVAPPPPGSKGTSKLNAITGNTAVAPLALQAANRAAAASATMPAAPSFIGKLMGIPQPPEDANLGATGDNSKNSLTGISASEDVPFSPNSSIQRGGVGSGSSSSRVQQSHSLVHDPIEKRDMFIVHSSEGFDIKVMISDFDRFDRSSRITVPDLRALLYSKPDVAALLYDCLVEEGMVSVALDESTSATESNTEGGGGANGASANEVEEDHQDIENLAESLAAAGLGRTKSGQSVNTHSTGELAPGDEESISPTAAGNGLAVATIGAEEGASGAANNGEAMESGAHPVENASS